MSPVLNGEGARGHTVLMAKWDESSGGRTHLGPNGDAVRLRANGAGTLVLFFWDDFFKVKRKMTLTLAKQVTVSQIESFIAFVQSNAPALNGSIYSDGHWDERPTMPNKMQRD